MEQADTAEQPPGGNPATDGDAAALEAILRWYVAMGVDAPMGDEPRDAFEQSMRQSAGEGERAAGPPAGTAPERGTQPAASAGGPLAADALIRQAEALAAAAGDLGALAAAWAVLPGCDLAAKTNGMIFSGGRVGAALMLVAGAPDDEDERQGSAFSGPKGQLLDAMLRAIGLTRGSVHLGHVVPWRPPGNRPPTPLELALCLPFARRQVALARPRLIVCLGERAAQPLLSSREPLSRLRGRWLRFEGEASTVRTLVTFPLDYLLKQPLAKRRAWADLQMVSEAVTEATAGEAASGGSG